MEERRIMLGGKKLTVDDVPNGVYIYLSSCELVETGDFDQSSMLDSVSGVAVVTDNVKLVIYPEQNWGAAYGQTGTLINGCTTKTENPESDMNGISNTEALYNWTGGTTTAAAYCRNIEFAHGKKGYLGSAGEYSEIYTLDSDISSAMRLIGGAQFQDEETYWTSTQYNGNLAWKMFWSSGYLSTGTKSVDYMVRAFAEL